MEQTNKEAAEETDSTPSTMPPKAGSPGYGSVPSPGLVSTVGASESDPLLIPQPEPVWQWQPMTKEELEVAAGGPGWNKVRCYLVLQFWVAWVAMLAASIAIIVMSPRPVVTPLQWWQKTLFYQLQPDLSLEPQTEGSGGLNALCDQLPYLRSLGIGTLILEGLFEKNASPLNFTKSVETLPEILHLLTESNKAGLKVVLDLCELDLLEPQDVAGNSDKPSNLSVHHALRFWLEQGVAGLAICDTDVAYSEKTLLEWRGVFKEFSGQEERIVVVKQTRRSLTPLSNVTLVDVVMKSILPSSRHVLSAQEVTDAIKMHLKSREDDIWPSWTVKGKASPKLKRLLLVLMMTLPGSPTIQYDKDLHQMQNVSLKAIPSHGEPNKSSNTDKKTKPSAVALFASMSQSRATEEALLYGAFTFLPFNSSTNSTLTPPSSLPILAFLRSWGCVHFLTLLNIGPEHYALDPAWAPSLPEAGVFLTSTGLDRLGSMTLDTLELRPHEAIVVKLFEAGSYS